jgi:hypothetical protein
MANFTISSTASPSSVEDQARLHSGQAVKFVEPRPIVWVSHEVYLLQTVTNVTVQIITIDIRANLQRDSGGDDVSVSLIMVDGHDQYWLENVMIRRDRAIMVSSTRGGRQRMTVSEMFQSLTDARRANQVIGYTMVMGMSSPISEQEMISSFE